MVLTQEIKKKLLDEFPFIPSSILAERYGISCNTIDNYAKKNGLKKDEEAIRRWKDEHRKPKPERDSSSRKKITYIIEDYPYYTNAELAEKYGETVTHIRSIASYHHLHKDWEFLRKPPMERYDGSVQAYKNNK